jgi:hypothetical protein
VLLALPRGVQVFQRLFHPQQIDGHAVQRLARLLRLIGGLRGAGAQRQQQLLFGVEPAAFVLHFAAQLGAGVLLVVQPSGNVLKLIADFSHLQLHLDLFGAEFVVQGRAFLLQSVACLLSLPLSFGLSLRSLLGQPFRLALRSELGGSVSLAIHDQQDQDQRSHGAEQNGQEGKRRNLQFVSASFHAAFPG